jgi:hypothetical protein
LLVEVVTQASSPREMASFIYSGEEEMANSEEAER